MELSSYIGLPFVEHGRDRAGVDCWGLLYLVFREQFGIALPSYVEDYRTVYDAQEIAALLNQESLGWDAIALGDARPGDGLLLRVKGRPWHVGLVSEAPWFLHADLTAGVVRERWDGALWAQRVAGCYRHPELAERLAGSNVR